MLPLRMLLVDDSADFLNAVTNFLTAEPHIEIVGRAGSGRQALEQIESLQPDLVLMDWSMPEMNGLDATRHIKADSNSPYIIMLTAHDSPQHRAAAAAAGADGFIVKEDFASQLLSSIDSLVKALTDNVVDESPTSPTQYQDTEQEQPASASNLLPNYAMASA